MGQLQGREGDATGGRVIGLGLFSGTAQSSVHGVLVRNITSEQPLRWWPTAFYPGAKTPAGDNFVKAVAPNGSISGVVVEGVVVAGERVLKDSDWGMKVTGSGAAAIRYGRQ